MKYLRIPLIILAAAILSCCNPGIRDKIVGIKIYDYNGDFGSLAGKWKDMGINTAFVSSALAANDSFRMELRKRDIAVWVIFPVFQNPELLKIDSSLFAVTSRGLKAKDDWVEFVCPSRKLYRVSKFDELSDIVRSLDPDGISIDFIRQFIFWEKIYPGRDPATIDKACYCDSCLSVFSGQIGIVIPDSCRTTPQKAEWIDNAYGDSWNTFRCQLITTMVQEIAIKARTIKPSIKVNFHAVPWREEDFEYAITRVAGQDLRKIAPYVDFISPMCYSQMLLRCPSWISGVVDDMNKDAPSKILPSIQVYPYYIENPFNKEDLRQCAVEAFKPPSRGVVFFSWPLFEADPPRMEVISGVLGRKASN